MGSKQRKNCWGTTRVHAQIIFNCKICTPIVSLYHYTKLCQGHKLPKENQSAWIFLCKRSERNWMLLALQTAEGPKTLDLPPDSNPYTPISSISFLFLILRFVKHNFQPCIGDLQDFIWFYFPHYLGNLIEMCIKLTIALSCYQTSIFFREDNGKFIYIMLY